MKEVKPKELAVALAIAELYHAPIINFLPHSSNYTTTLIMFRRKKYVKSKKESTWVLTDKGRVKYLSDIIAPNQAIADKFKQVEDFINNL